MRRNALGVYDALWRISSGIIGGMLVAAILQSIYESGTGEELLKLGMLVGSFAGYISTIRRT